MPSPSPAPDSADLAAGVRRGDRSLLSRAITLVESTRPDHARQAREVLDLLAPQTGHAVRVGITGVPGVGKSSFLDALGSLLTGRGHRVAVLAVDPSSQVSGGSILGDKTRMERLARDPAAYVRPSPAADSAGGVAHRTREVSLLCEAAGYDIVLIETVGVGQSEVAVSHMVDTFVLLLLAGAGDELQGIKRGIMELAHVVVVHKADGDNLAPAERARGEVATALRFLHHGHGGWQPPVLLASSLEGRGVDQVWQAVLRHRAELGTDGLEQQRRDQALHWFDSAVSDLLQRRLFADDAVRRCLPELRERVAAGAIRPEAAAEELLRRYRPAD